MRRLTARIVAVLALVAGIGTAVASPATAAPREPASHTHTQVHTFADWWW